MLDLRSKGCDTVLVERPFESSGVFARAMVHKVVVLSRSLFEMGLHSIMRCFSVLASIVIELRGYAHLAVSRQMRLTTVNPSARCATHLVMNFIHTDLFIHIDIVCISGIFRNQVDPVALNH